MTYPEPNNIMPLSTAEGVKALPRPELQKSAADDWRPMGWRDHLTIGAVAIGITSLAIIAARVIVLYAPR